MKSKCEGKTKEGTEKERRKKEESSNIKGVCRLSGRCPLRSERAPFAILLYLILNFFFMSVNTAAPPCAAKSHAKYYQLTV